MEAVQKQSFICVHFKDNRETSGIPKNIEYSMKDNRIILPVSTLCHHGLVDGKQLADFYELLEKELKVFIEN